MIFIYIFVIAVVQGITEFLPISSSGHLVLLHWVFGRGGIENLQENLALDVSVHIGTLFAALLYFRSDILKMMYEAGGILTVKQSLRSSLLVKILIASIPVIIAGFLLSMYPQSFQSHLWTLAISNIIFATLLWWSDQRPEHREFQDLSIKDCLLIGLSQVLALIPGTSRSGVTMTAARFLGINRQASARFSLLLGIVAISGAGTLLGLDVFKNPGQFDIKILLIGAFISFISAYFAISVMMGWLKRQSFLPFVLYRYILGAVLIGYLIIV